MAYFKQIADVLAEIFKAKPPVRDPSIIPVKPPVADNKVEAPVYVPSPIIITGNVVPDGYTPIEAKTIKWRIPADTTSVMVRVCEPNGRLISEYTISDFITLRPGQILLVISK